METICNVNNVMRSPNNVGKAAQTDPMFLRYASAIKERKKCRSKFYSTGTTEFFSYSIRSTLWIFSPNVGTCTKYFQKLESLTPNHYALNLQTVEVRK